MLRKERNPTCVVGVGVGVDGEGEGKGRQGGEKVKAKAKARHVTRQTVFGGGGTGRGRRGRGGGRRRTNRLQTAIPRIDPPHPPTFASISATSLRSLHLPAPVLAKKSSMRRAPIE